MLAQRLVRRTCQACGGLGQGNSGRRGRGCDKCLGSGYFGRIAVYEIMKMNDTLRKMIAQGADAITLAEAVRSLGFRTMLEDARDKLALGLTDEVEIQCVPY